MNNSTRFLIAALMLTVFRSSCRAESESERLYAALYAGDAKTSEDISSADGWSPDFKGSGSETIITLAGKRGYRSVIQKAIQKGGDINSVNALGQTALHYAILGRDEEFALWLLEVGADPATTTAYGWTSLMLAIDAGMPRLQAKLSGLGVGVRGTAFIYAKAFSSACAAGDDAAVLRIIRSCSAVVDHYDSHGALPLTYAIANDKGGVEDVLMKSGCDAGRFDFSVRESPGNYKKNHKK